MTQAGDNTETIRQGHSTSYHKLQYRDDDLITRTYLLTPELVNRLERMVEEHRVGHSDLVRFLLDRALTQIERGNWEIPTKPPRLFLIDHDL